MSGPDPDRLPDPEDLDAAGAQGAAARDLPLEADEADAAEQALVVELDEQER